VSARRLLSGLIAAVFALVSVPAAEAQLWKPKKKAVTTAKKPAKKPARKKKVVRRKKPADSVVKFGPPRDRDPETDDDDRPRDDEPDDNPRITVYDGDREE
jgi:hypothetical protein